MSNVRKLGFTDKDGEEIHFDDIVFNGKHYYRIYINSFNEFEMLSSTNGYIHNVQPKDLKEFSRIGAFEENKHLLISD